ncbi:MAG TPA: hypothetical protein VF041_08215 [Gemmatimonadaceae bacterium]
MTRNWWVPLALAMMAGAAHAQQQEPDSVTQRRAFEARRAELVKELQETQEQLSQLRGERVQLEARVENVLAATMEKRARTLLMSSEQNAMLQLDGTLTAAQDNMLAQRDRMRALGDAVRRRTGAVLVVLFRADSGQATGLGPVDLKIDEAAAATRTYTPTATAALQAGAVDQVYRSEVLPTTHTITVSATVNGQSVVQGVNVNAVREAVTYVQFTMRNGQLVPSTWTSQGTTPF